MAMIALSETADRAYPTVSARDIAALTEAANYSPEGLPITMCWQVEGTMAVLRVRDRGRSMPESGCEVLFTRFGRVSGSRMRAGHVGTGLGLFLGRQLAEVMGGDLDLETTGLEGSTFRLRLPAAEPLEARSSIAG